MSCLQLVQNAAARLLKGKRKSEHNTPVLISLHWLPAKYRIDKVLLFVFKSLRNQAPQYLYELLQPPSQERSLSSGDSDLMFLELDLKTGVITLLRSSVPSYGIAFQLTSDSPEPCQFLNPPRRLTFLNGLQYPLILIGI